MTMVRKQFTFAVKSVDEATATVTAYVSTVNVDRADEIILPRAFLKRLELYLRNGVHLWAHDPYDLANVIGKAIDAKVDGEGLLVTFQYAVDVNPQAKMAFDLIAGGYLNAFSVGFQPVAWIGGKEVDLVLYPELAGVDMSQVWRVYTEVELYEISLVAIPCNRESVVVGRDANGGPQMRKSQTRLSAECAHVRSVADSLEKCSGKQDDVHVVKDAAEMLSETSGRLKRLAARIAEPEPDPEDDEDTDEDDPAGDGQEDGDAGDDGGDGGAAAAAPPASTKEAKSGRVLSDANCKRLKSAYRKCQHAMTHLVEMAEESGISREFLDKDDDEEEAPAAEEPEDPDVEDEDDEKSFDLALIVAEAVMAAAASED